MKFTEALAQVMERRGTTKAELARLRKVTPQSVNSMFSGQKSLSVELASDVARVMGYRVALVPFDRKLPEGSFELEA